jgi:methionyl-tRNA formyltransferase
MTGDRLKIGVLATDDRMLAGRFLQALLDHRVNVDLVLLDPAISKPRDLAIHAQRTGGMLPPLPLPGELRYQKVSGHNGPDALASVDEAGLDLLLNAGTPGIVGNALLSSAPLGILNCHPGRLPAYRGACAVEHAVMDDEPVANTVHRMTDGVDEGPILMIEEVPLDGVKGYQDLRCAVYRHSCDLLAMAARALQDGTLGQEDFTAQSAGVWHKPVSDDVLEEIELRLEAGRYTPLRELTRT